MPKMEPADVEIYEEDEVDEEDLKLKVTIDGVDMTESFGVQNMEKDKDVNKILRAVSTCRVCDGVEDFVQDYLVYFPDAKKRGYKYHADQCPVVLDDDVD